MRESEREMRERERREESRACLVHDGLGALRLRPAVLEEEDEPVHRPAGGREERGERKAALSAPHSRLGGDLCGVERVQLRHLDPADACRESVRERERREGERGEGEGETDRRAR